MESVCHRRIGVVLLVIAALFAMAEVWALPTDVSQTWKWRNSCHFEQQGDIGGHSEVPDGGRQVLDGVSYTGNRKNKSNPENQTVGQSLPGLVRDRRTRWPKGRNVHSEVSKLGIERATL